MDSSIIAAVQACGFDVYMRDASRDKWLIFTDGTNIGYLQENRLEPFTLATVHIPNATTGTGFRIDRTAPGIVKEDLARAFVLVPEWADGSSRASVRKWPSIQAFLGADDFNRGYKLVRA